MSKSILVLGATGKQGSAVCSACLEKGMKVYGLSRNPASQSAEALKAMGATIVQGDFTQRPSLLAALQSSGVNSMYIMTHEKMGMFRAGAYRMEEASAGMLAIDIAKEVGISFVVLSSVSGCDTCPEALANFKAKYDIEQYLEASGIRHAVLRPTTLLDSFNDPQLGGISKDKIVGMLSSPDIKMWYVACRDLGKAAAICFENPDAYNGHKINCASCHVSGREVARCLSDVTGSQVTYQSLLPSWLLCGCCCFMPDFKMMHQWWVSSGYPVDESTMENFKVLVPDAFGPAEYFKSLGFDGHGPHTSPKTKLRSP